MELTGDVRGLSEWRWRASLGLRALLEAVVLAMVCLTPWAYGAVHPGFEFLLICGVGFLLLLWAGRMLLEGRLSWQRCPVALCLAGLFLCGIGQLTPFARSVLDQLSPATARLNEQLLPSQQEQLPDGSSPPAIVPPAGSTVSLYPFATRRRLLQLLAVFLVFVVVRNNAAPGAPRRLAVAAVVNGALLAVFALVQQFSSPPGTLYWTYPSLGTVYGPFICRNHFSYYINLCLGLGLGLLWEKSANQGTGREDDFSGASSRWLAPFRLLQDPATLWLCVALALMLTSVGCSLSRGGFLALVGGVGVCLVLQMTGSTRLRGRNAVLLSLTLAIGLAGWFGLTSVESRLTTLWGRTTLQDNRLSLWSSALGMVGDFPIWGTGYGTYQYLAPLYRPDTLFADFTIDHVHNEYLELLVEGGFLGLFLGVLAMVLVFRSGYRAIRTRRNPAARGLALGYLFGLATLLTHNFGDFGLHIPAIALLATVVCAYLSVLGSARSPGRAEAGGSAAMHFQLGGVASLGGAVACVVLGLVLCDAGWRAHRADSFRRTAFRLVRDSRERQIAFLEAAARLTPDDADLHTEIAQAHFDLFGASRERQARDQILRDTAGLFLANPTAGFPGGLVAVEAVVIPWLAKAWVHRQQVQEEQLVLISQHLVPALRHYLQARNLCPLSPGPQMGLALNAAHLRHADPRDTYATRVLRLAPSDAALWYFAGLQDLRADQPERAWPNWRRCLELSDRYLPPILEGARRHLNPEELVLRVVPDRPELLLAAAIQHRPVEEGAQDQAPFLQRALALLNARAGTLNAKDLHTRALALGLLGRTTEALAAYQVLLAQEPWQVAWRLEFVRLLHEEGQLQQAQDELLTLLAQQPKHAEARELLNTVVRELARNR